MNMQVAMLQFARMWLIAWVTIAIMPVEIVFDGIEAELERQGVHLD